MGVSLQGDVALGTVVWGLGQSRGVDCHSLAVCVPQKLSPDSSSWPRPWPRLLLLS